MAHEQHTPALHGIMAEFDTPYTPAHTMILALRQALRRIKDEGLEQVWDRHRRMSEACQAGSARRLRWHW